jgi:hypothetical protein
MPGVEGSAQVGQADRRAGAEARKWNGIRLHSMRRAGYAWPWIGSLSLLLMWALVRKTESAVPEGTPTALLTATSTVVCERNINKLLIISIDKIRITVFI